MTASASTTAKIAIDRYPATLPQPKRFSSFYLEIIVTVEVNLLTPQLEQKWPTPLSSSS
jgi:hypothetical protein